MALVQMPSAKMKCFLRKMSADGILGIIRVLELILWHRMSCSNCNK